MPVPTPHRSLAASGPLFVVLVLAGNSLTETAAVTTAGSAADDALATLESQSGSALVHAGLGLELAAFVSLAVFAAYLVDLLRRRDALGLSGVLAAVACCWLLGVKVSSGAPYLAGLEHHDTLTADTALALTGSNGASFVLSWLPFAVLVAAAGRALYDAGLVGRPTWIAALVVGLAGTAAALMGVPTPGDANPLPFLAGLLWLLVVGLRLTLRAPQRRTAAGPAGVPA